MAATVVAVMVASGTPALAALPQLAPDDTFMVNGRVRALAAAGGLTWIGGRFTSLLNQNGAVSGSATGLAAFTAAGVPAAVSPPAFTGVGIEVWDMHLGPDGVLYVAGKFGYTRAGKNYRNLVGIDPTTGSVVHAYRPSVLKSVYSDGVTIYAGGSKLWAYDVISGTARTGFAPVELLVDDSLRGHPTAEMVRDVQPWGPWILGTGQFDYVRIDGVWDEQKVFFRLDPTTGSVDPDWAPANIGQSGAAWGHKLLIDGGTLFSAAGGSDYVATYDLETVDVQGRAPLVWSTDTSGSAQSISFWNTDTLIVGGHFESVEDADTPQCGSNQDPIAGCWRQPRLVALDRTTGAAIQTWTPSVCCQYNGVWITMVVASQLHIGGEFNTVGGQTQKFYGRLTEVI
jgi:hypothetical protein